jgi:hypothetical protein
MILASGGPGHESNTSHPFVRPPARPPSLARPKPEV